MRRDSQDTSTRYQVREITSMSELDALEASWRALVQRAENPAFIHEPCWWRAVCTELLPERVAFYSVYDGERLIAILPLEKRSWGVFFFKLRWLQLPTDSNIYLNDLLLDKSYARQPVLASVLDYISRDRGFRWDFCRLRKFRGDSALFQQAQDKGKLTRKINACFFIPCGNRYDLQALSKKTWKNTARLARRAEKDFGSVSIDASDLAGTRDDFYRQFLDIESSGWKGAEGTGTSVASDPTTERFFRSLVVTCGDDWHARVFLLRFGDRAVAALLAIHIASIWYILKIGYAEPFRQYGPGSMLLQRFIEQVADDPAVTEVNLTTAPDWAARWHFRQTDLFEAYLFSSTVLAKASHLSLRLGKIAVQARARWANRPQFRGATQ